MFQVNINILAVIVAAVSTMVVGFVWYALPVFGRSWMAAIGKTEAELGSPGPAYALTLVGSFVRALALALVVGVAPAQTLLDGALVGLLVGVGFEATSYAATYIFSSRSLTLYLIDAGYHVVSLIVMGAILGVWR